MATTERLIFYGGADPEALEETDAVIERVREMLRLVSKRYDGAPRSLLTRLELTIEFAPMPVQAKTGEPAGANLDRAGAGAGVSTIGVSTIQPGDGRHQH